MTTPDAYAATAAAYDLFSTPARAGQVAALEELLPSLQPEHGPILDIGAGSGNNTVFVLERLASASVCALEPSRAMRALILSKLVARPEWFDRVTVRPESFFDATLPERVGGAILLGVIGHFDSGERAAVLAELARRLPPEGAVLLDLQDLPIPVEVPAYVFTAATIGALTYRCIAEARPVGGERMHWRMTYLTLEDECVLCEDVVDYEYHHPSPETLTAEAESAGMRAKQLPDGHFWLLTRA